MISKSAVAAAALAASGLFAPPAQATTPALAWAACADHAEYQCATMEVPLSYQDPDGPRIQLALGRLPATDQKHKQGTIFYNPGGPGSSGRFPPALTAALHQRFDIVGFDPRGVGASAPLRCFTDAGQAEPALRGLLTFPITDDQMRQQLTAVHEVTDRCAANGGALLTHLSTANVARDLDRIRDAIGEPKVRYYGKSYGTYLGETYANLFPDRVGAMVLDAVNDPVNWSTGYRPQDAGVPFSVRLDAYDDAERALRSFFSACAASPECAFREPGDLMSKYNRILDRLAASPVTITDPMTGQPATVTYQDLVIKVHNLLLNPADARQLADFLQAVSVGPPVRAALASTVRTPIDSLMGGVATFCSDATNPSDPLVWQGFAAKADRSARGFGAFDTYKSVSCATWPVRDPDHYAGPWNRPTAPILLLTDRRGDPETPYPGAKRAERLLANAHLLALDAYGHGALGRSACIDRTVDRYVLHGGLPAPGAVCAADRQPFAP